jgi:transcription elongation factor Elf1
MSFVDSKYIGLLSPRLQKFKQVKNNLYNFRCPYCGDSQRNKNKARGYIYQLKNDHNYKCHNCGMSKSFTNLLKDLDTSLYDQYVMERYKNGLTGKRSNTPEPDFNFQKPDFFTKRENSKNLKKIDLPRASEVLVAKQYLEKRKLNPYKFYYTDKFKTWVNSLKPTFKDLKYDEPRIIIPLFYKKELIGFQGRLLGPGQIKYITIMLNEDAPKIYGLDEIDKTKTVYITEGPFDSNFISNSIAMCGADANISGWDFDDVVWVYDNEPRNREICDRMSKTINSGYKIVIWPSSIKEKDINDMVLSGLDVQSVIKLNTYSDLQANLKFTTWKKI